MTTNLFQPQLIVHADWSLRPEKRWQAQAVRGRDGRYTAHAPQYVSGTPIWLRRLHGEAKGGGVFVGLDFPLGLPLKYARLAGIDDFAAVLPQLGLGEWSDFYRAAESKEEVGVKRPFYPQRPGGTRRQHLLDGLGLAHFDDLRRLCDLKQPHRPAAAPIFWTMGAQQVGKAAITGWRDMLVPALRDGELDVALWPFHGDLIDLLQPGRIVVAETYPAECLHHLGIAFPATASKRRQRDRAAHAAALLAWANATGVTLSPQLQADITAGFGHHADGEDRFDAIVGLFGMLNVVLGKRPSYTPKNPDIRRIEGWILGQRPVNRNP